MGRLVVVDDDAVVDPSVKDVIAFLLEQSEEFSEAVIAGLQRAQERERFVGEEAENEAPEDASRFLERG